MTGSVVDDGRRQAQVQADARTVSVIIDNTREEIQYSGVTIQRRENDDVVEQTWVPMGSTPRCADDEALVDAWHAALQWSWARSQA